MSRDGLHCAGLPLLPARARPRRHLLECPAKLAAEQFPAFFHNDFLKLLTLIVPHFSPHSPPPAAPTGLGAPGRPAVPRYSAARGQRTWPGHTAPPPAAARSARPWSRTVKTLGEAHATCLPFCLSRSPPGPRVHLAASRHRRGQGTGQREAPSRPRARRRVPQQTATLRPAGPRAQSLQPRGAWVRPPRVAGRRRAPAVPAGAAGGCSPLARAGPARRAAATPARSAPGPSPRRQASSFQCSIAPLPRAGCRGRSFARGLALLSRATAGPELNPQRCGTCGPAGRGRGLPALAPRAGQPGGRDTGALAQSRDSRDTGHCKALFFWCLRAPAACAEPSPWDPWVATFGLRPPKY